MTDFLKAVLTLQPDAWLVLFGMLLVLLGVLGTVPIPPRRPIVVQRPYKLLAVGLGIPCIIGGTWMNSKTKLNSQVNSVIAAENGPLTPEAQKSVEGALTEYEKLQSFKAMAVSEQGAVGTSFREPTELSAKLTAWAYCVYWTHEKKSPCRVVYVENKKFGNW